MPTPIEPTSRASTRRPEMSRSSTVAGSVDESENVTLRRSITGFGAMRRSANALAPGSMPVVVGIVTQTSPLAVVPRSPETTSW
jgi:hypothetical protein